MLAVEGGPATIRPAVGSRNQARRLSADGPPGRLAGPLLHAQLLILKQLDDEVSGMVKMTGSGDVDGTRGWLEDKFCEGAAALGLTAETKK